MKPKSNLCKPPAITCEAIVEAAVVDNYPSSAPFTNLLSSRSKQMECHIAEQKYETRVIVIERRD